MTTRLSSATDAYTCYGCLQKFAEQIFFTDWERTQSLTVCESRCKVDSQMPTVCLDELELFLVPFAVTCLQVVFEYIW